MACVKIKKEKCLTNLNNIDGEGKMERAINKWKNISTFVMKSSYTIHLRNGSTCKDKWGFIFGDFQKIYNCMVGIGHKEDY